MDYSSKKKTISSYHNGVTMEVRKVNDMIEIYINIRVTFKSPICVFLLCMQKRRISFSQESVYG
jgi:hypothetical protein